MRQYAKVIYSKGQKSVQLFHSSSTVYTVKLLQKGVDENRDSENLNPTSQSNEILRRSELLRSIPESSAVPQKKGIFTYFYMHFLFKTNMTIV